MSPGRRGGRATTPLAPIRVFTDNNGKCRNYHMTHLTSLGVSQDERHCGNGWVILGDVAL